MMNKSENSVMYNYTLAYFLGGMPNHIVNYQVINWYSSGVFNN